MNAIETTVRVILLGVGATAVLDLWLALLQRMGMPALNFAFIGRWAGHLLRGRIAHASIAKAPPVPGELAWGWLTHYAVGIAFAGLLVFQQGAAWMQAPSIMPAIAVGLITMVFPLFVM